jgi:hypothetical protein
MGTVGAHIDHTIEIGVFTVTLGAFWNVCHLNIFFKDLCEDNKNIGSSHSFCAKGNRITQFHTL